MMYVPSESASTCTFRLCPSTDTVVSWLRVALPIGVHPVVSIWMLGLGQKFSRVGLITADTWRGFTKSVGTGPSGNVSTVLAGMTNAGWLAGGGRGPSSGTKWNESSSTESARLPWGPPLPPWYQKFMVAHGAGVTVGEGTPSGQKCSARMVFLLSMTRQ